MSGISVNNSFGGNSGKPSFKNKNGIAIGIFAGIIFMLCLANYINTVTKLFSGKESNNVEYVFSFSCSIITIISVYIVLIKK